MKFSPGVVPQWPSSRGLMCSSAQRLAQQRVVEQVDLPDRQVVRGAPVRVHAGQLGRVEGRVGDGRDARDSHDQPSLGRSARERAKVGEAARTAQGGGHSVATIGGIVRSDANSPGPVDVSASPHARLRPLAAEIDGGLWAERRRLNRELLLPEGARELEEAGNFHNLRVAAGHEDGEFRGMRFADSDVYKWLEARRLGARARAVRGAGSRSPTTPPRWSRPPRTTTATSTRTTRSTGRAERFSEPRLGPRALLRRPPDPGGRRRTRAAPATTRLLDVARRARRPHRSTRFGPADARRARRAPGDRDRAGRAVPR